MLNKMDIYAKNVRTLLQSLVLDEFREYKNLKLESNPSQVGVANNIIIQAHNLRMEYNPIFENPNMSRIYGVMDSANFSQDYLTRPLSEEPVQDMLAIYAKAKGDMTIALELHNAPSRRRKLQFTVAEYRLMELAVSQIRAKVDTGLATHEELVAKNQIDVFMHEQEMSLHRKRSLDESFARDDEQVFVARYIRDMHKHDDHPSHKIKKIYGPGRVAKKSDEQAVPKYSKSVRRRLEYESRRDLLEFGMSFCGKFGFSLRSYASLFCAPQNSIIKQETMELLDNPKLAYLNVKLQRGISASRGIPFTVKNLQATGLYELLTPAVRAFARGEYNVWHNNDLVTKRPLTFEYQRPLGY